MYHSLLFADSSIKEIVKVIQPLGAVLQGRSVCDIVRNGVFVVYGSIQILLVVCVPQRLNTKTRKHSSRMHIIRLSDSLQRPPGQTPLP